MRKIFLVSAFAIACGSSSNSGGGGGALSGTVGGRAFMAGDVEAIVAGTGSSPCSLPLGPGGTNINVGVNAFAVLATSYGNACGDYATTQCKLHQTAQTVTILFARLNPSGSQPPLATGTYTIASSATTVLPDGTSGFYFVAFAQAVTTTNASCALSTGSPSPSIQGGTLRIDSVAGPITGHVSVTFTDGSSLSGDFSAPVCGGTTPNVCTLAATQALCTGTPTCVP
jgi:hypothetical protein